MRGKGREGVALESSCIKDGKSDDAKDDNRKEKGKNTATECGRRREKTEEMRPEKRTNLMTSECEQEIKGERPTGAKIKGVDGRCITLYEQQRCSSNAEDKAERHEGKKKEKRNKSNKEGRKEGMKNIPK